MKFSATFVTYVLSVATFVTSTPMDSRPWMKMLTKASARYPDGAIYFITNDPDDNMVITASINSDGTLRLDRAVAAGGRGLHGIPANGAAPGPDGLFSQGSVSVSMTNNVLATVNAGSNTVSLFSIDPRKPTNIELLGGPVSSEGEFPQSVAFNSDGSRLCALNGGAVNGVVCYKVDKTRGLIPMPNTLRSLGLNQTTPATAPATVSHIMFSGDDKTLLASYKGTATTPGYVAAWDVNADGSLSAQHKQLALPGGGKVGFGMTPVHGQNAVFVTDPGNGFEAIDLSGARPGSHTTPTGERASCWASYSDVTKNYYATDAGASAVHEVSIDANLNMKVVALHNVTANATPLDTASAVVRGKGYLYVLGSAINSIEVLALEGPGQSKLIASARAVGVDVAYRHEVVCVEVAPV